MTLVPAGHVLGSAQAVVRWKGLTMVVSGDYKRRRDPTCPPFEPVPCDVFITEATFGLPVFRHPDDREEIGRLLRSVAQFPERAHLVGAYALGKAQRVIRAAARGRLGPADLCPRRAGAAERPLRAARRRPRAAGAGHRRPRRRTSPAQIVIAPPSALAGPLEPRRFPDPVPRLRLRLDAGPRPRPPARRRAAPGDLRPRRLGRAYRHRPTSCAGELWITHGREEALVHWCGTQGIRARPLHLLGNGTRSWTRALRPTDALR